MRNHVYMGFPGGSVVKNPPANAGDEETGVQSLGQKDPLEKEMATHSGILAWEIPWTEETGRVQPTQSQRVRRDWALTGLKNDMMAGELDLLLKWRLEKLLDLGCEHFGLLFI